VSITITIKYQHSLKMALKTFTTADGSANQALVTNGSGVLSFAAVGASAGQVIQVVSSTDSTERSTSSTSFAFPSGCTLSVTITPSSASNKILVLLWLKCYSTTSGGAITIFRGSTNLGTSGTGFCAVSADAYGFVGVHYLDSPATTSATTYQVRASNSGAQPFYVNTGDSRASITVMEIKG
jgi:hypothetical protein